MVGGRRVIRPVAAAIRLSVGLTGTEIHWWVTYAYFAWAAVELVRARHMHAWKAFRKTL